jgi:hypothetical protein
MRKILCSRTCVYGFQGAVDARDAELFEAGINVTAPTLVKSSAFFLSRRDAVSIPIDE